MVDYNNVHVIIEYQGVVYRMRGMEFVEEIADRGDPIDHKIDYTDYYVLLEKKGKRTLAGLCDIGDIFYFAVADLLAKKKLDRFKTDEKPSIEE
jgi:hypothetical protein